MKILVISSLFVIILISGVFTISLCLEEPEPFKSLEELADFPMLVYYNGTRFHLKEFNPINFEEKNMVFSLSIDILIEGYSDVIYVFSENSNIPTIIKAENEGEENGTYKIKDLYIKPNGDIDKYPYDEYRCNLTFKVRIPPVY